MKGSIYEVPAVAKKKYPDLEEAKIIHQEADICFRFKLGDTEKTFVINVDTFLSFPDIQSWFDDQESSIFE